MSGGVVLPKQMPCLLDLARLGVLGIEHAVKHSSLDRLTWVGSVANMPLMQQYYQEFATGMWLKGMHWRLSKILSRHKRLSGQ